MVLAVAGGCGCLYVVLRTEVGNSWLWSPPIKKCPTTTLSKAAERPLHTVYSGHDADGYLNPPSAPQTHKCVSDLGVTYVRYSVITNYLGIYRDVCIREIISQS